MWIQSNLVDINIEIIVVSGGFRLQRCWKFSLLSFWVNFNHSRKTFSSKIYIFSMYQSTQVPFPYIGIIQWNMDLAINTFQHTCSDHTTLFKKSDVISRYPGTSRVNNLNEVMLHDKQTSGHPISGNFLASRCPQAWKSVCFYNLYAKPYEPF